MVTRLLNLCGLWLGEERDLLPPAPDNPDGFWENTHLIAINETVLSAFGGAWDCPPALPERWVDDSRLDGARALAADTLGAFADKACWGWKDPRNSLTFPFWDRLLPGLKVVICVRNPLEVARSLRAWTFSPELSLTLWYQFNDTLLRTVPPERRLVAHYDAFFAAPEASLRRVLAFAGMQAPDATISGALAAVEKRLRHHRLTDIHLREAGISPAILDLYAALCAEAEVTEPASVVTNGTRPRPAPPQPRAATGDGAAHVGGLNRAVVEAMDLRAEARDLKAQATAAHEANTHLRAWAAELEGRLAAAQEAHAEQDTYAAGLEARIVALETEHAAQDTYAAGLGARIAALEAAHTAQASRVRHLEAEHAAQDTYAAQLEARIASLQADHAAQDAYARQLEAQLAIVRGDHGTLHDRLAAHQSEHAAAGAYARSLETRIAAADTDRRALLAYVDTLESALAAVRAEAIALHAAFADVRAQHEREESALATARRDYAALRDWTDTVTARLTDAERGRTAQEATIATLRAALAARDDTEYHPRSLATSARGWAAPRIARARRAVVAALTR